ncbi:AEC family transporter [Schwartzia sp. (in: firmicutes)]
MDIKMKLLVFAVDLICPLILGYACKYQKRLGDTFFNKMILNNILVVCPIVSFLSFWVMPITREFLWLPLISIALGLIPGAMAYWLAGYKYKDFREQGAYVMAASLSNLGTIGGICVFLIYGESGYAYQQIATLFQYVLMFMFCYPLARVYETKAQGRSGQKVSILSMLFSKKQLAVLGILLGGVLQYAGVPRPEAFNGVTQIFIHLGAWTGLIPVGYSVEFSKIKKYWTSLFDLSFIKFIAAPAVVYGLSHLVIKTPDMLGSLLILSATPTAVNAVVTARLYNLSIDLSVAAFIVTTILFLFIVYPALFFVLAG